MSTLGLSGQTEQEEGLWKRLFWPSIRNSHDADLIEQQGFWICTLVAVLTGALLAFTSHPILAALLFLFYFLGGMGLREGSKPAATLVFAAFLLDKIASFRMGLGAFAFVGYIVLAILLANVRGAVLVARWKKLPRSTEEDAEPTRFNETWRDKLCDQLPRKAWPRLRFGFYALAALVVVLEIAGVWAAWFRSPVNAGPG